MKTSLQKRIWQNKVEKGFNINDVPKEFCYLYGDLAEAYEAYLKKKDDLGSELADVAIYLYGLSEMLGFDLDSEILAKMQINESRKYSNEGGILKKV